MHELYTEIEKREAEENILKKQQIDITNELEKYENVIKENQQRIKHWKKEVSYHAHFWCKNFRNVICSPELCVCVCVCVCVCWGICFCCSNWVFLGSACGISSVFMQRSFCSILSLNMLSLSTVENENSIRESLDNSVLVCYVAGEVETARDRR